MQIKFENNVGNVLIIDSLYYDKSNVLQEEFVKVAEELAKKWGYEIRIYEQNGLEEYMKHKYVTVKKLMEVLSKEKGDSLILISVTDEDKSTTVGMPISEMYTGIQIGNQGGIMLVADLRVKDSMYE